MACAEDCLCFWDLFLLVDIGSISNSSEVGCWQPWAPKHNPTSLVCRSVSMFYIVGVRERPDWHWLKAQNLAARNSPIALICSRLKSNHMFLTSSCLFFEHSGNKPTEEPASKQASKPESKSASRPRSKPAGQFDGVLWSCLSDTVEHVYIYIYISYTGCNEFFSKTATHISIVIHMQILWMPPVPRIPPVALKWCHGTCSFFVAFGSDFCSAGGQGSKWPTERLLHLPALVGVLPRKMERLLCSSVLDRVRFAKTWKG